MTRQLDLLAPAILEIKPPLGRTEPRLWVRRLVLWSEPGVILREINLRAGLNIIWSPDPGDQENRVRNQSIGHGSGKTLFCRLIRYCLGEDRYAPEDQRASIALAFPRGAVGAEIILDGTVWAIVRPIGMTRQHYAIPGGNLNSIIAGQIESTGIEPFLKAVQSQVLPSDITSLISGDRRFHAWLVALAWLTRDQECRFDKVLDWRSASSDSGSPARGLSSEKTLNALRALIGAITLEECTLREEVVKLDGKHKDVCQEIGRRRWEAGRTQSRLISQLRLRRQELPAGRLAIDILRNTACEELARVAEVKAETDAADLDRLRSNAEVAKMRASDLSKDLAEIEGKIPVIERLISTLRGELPALSVSLNRAEKPVCPICEVPIDHALAEGCKLSHKLPNSDELRARWQKLTEQIAEESDLLLQLKERRMSVKSDISFVSQKADELTAQLRSAEQAREARTDAWYKARRLVDDADRLGSLLGALDEMQSAADRLIETIDAKKERTIAFRGAQANVFHRLSQFFDAIIRHVSGPDAEGKVAIDGNGLRLIVKLGGERSTPAIDSLKVIVFDLAVLCMSLEGRTHIPPFLIHDSPREADLGLSIYHEIFHVVQKLEQTGDHPLFQYIVTTTTRPPDELLEKPWLSETLGGAPADARLLRRNL